MDKDLLTRIADALDRLAPPHQAAPVPDAPACVWRQGQLAPATGFRPVSLDLLFGVDPQKALVLENSHRLAAGHAAHDILLWGARGTGKSALVKSVAARVHQEGGRLRLVEASCDELESLPDLFDVLAQSDVPAIVFIDDIGFEQGDPRIRHIRSVLDGGISARPAHVRLYVTANRRHIVPRNLEEQASAINPRDAVDDNLALADRFGLSLGFHVCTQDVWLEMVAGYARHLGLQFDPQEALTWVTQRGARSGRMAWHYAVELAGRAGKTL
ncbi:MAG: ATP-binding protein [Chakrabartia sp.]